MSLLAQVVYISVGDIPDYLVRPLLVIGVIIAIYFLHLYTTWSLTEEKFVEKIAQHRDEPLADLDAPDNIMVARKEENKEENKEDITTQHVTYS